MDDNTIVELFFERNEAGLAELSRKYGGYFSAIAERIVPDREDALSCVNDAYLRAWNTIPPARPSVLKAFVGKLVKCAAVSMLRAQTAKKRGGGEFSLALDEISELVSGNISAEDELEKRELINKINDFLKKRREFDRRAFVLRYWHCESVSEIAARLCATEGKVSAALSRTRGRLREFLEKEGYEL